MGGEPGGRLRRIKLWALLVALQIFVLELLLSAYYFQRRAEYSSAIVFYVVHTLGKLKQQARTEPLGIYEDDPRFGYRHRANTQGRHRTDSFDVVYRIGSERERPIPAPDAPLGRVVFLGSSFTFGFGVGEEQAYPYLLATEHWRQWKVVNEAVSGWGTLHAYMQLEQDLEGPTAPDVALYNTIPDHICRNHLRPLWLEMLSQSKRTHPHFELEGGKPVFEGLATLADAVQDEEVLRRKELALSEAFILGMHERATASGVRFVMVLLPQRWDVACGPVAWPPSLIRSLSAHGVAMLDLSELASRMTWLENDAHPDAAGHQVLATAIAGSFVGDLLNEVAAERAAPR